MMVHLPAKPMPDHGDEEDEFFCEYVNPKMARANGAAKQFKVSTRKIVQVLKFLGRLDVHAGPRQITKAIHKSKLSIPQKILAGIIWGATCRCFCQHCTEGDGVMYR